MKKAIIFLLVSVCFCNCRQKKETIDFVTLKESEFNSKPFQFSNNVPASLKQAHDSCMGFSFDANAVFLETRDRYFIGSIVNRKSLKIVNTLSDLGLTMPQLISNFNIIARACYEKSDLHFPLKLILGENFHLQFPNASEAINKEINDAILSLGETEMKTGSWMYIDMKYALGRILDSTKDSRLISYRNNLLDTSNMVLAAAESIADVSFVINTPKNMSESLQAFLRTQPSISKPSDQVSIQLFYLNNNKFQIAFTGYFPVIGKFMKAQLK